jgi:hypothetical protein
VMASNYENNCGWTLERIEPFLDDELPPGELARFQTHVDKCETCADELAFASRVVNELRSLPMHEAPARVMEPVTSSATPPIAERLAEWFNKRWVILRRPAMATMIVMIAAVGTFVVTQHDRIPGNGATELSQEELQDATEQAMIAFAYVGKYGRRANYIIRDELDENVVDRLEEAVGISVRETMSHTKILETTKRSKRSDT